MRLNSGAVMMKDAGLIGRNDALFRAVFNEAGIGIAVLDSSGRVMDVNHTLDSILSQNRISAFADLLPEGQASLGPLLERSADGLCFERKLSSFQYQDYWVHVTISAVRDEHGAILHMIGIVEDISAHKQSEAALREAEKRFRSIFENAIEGIFQTTIDGQYLAANPALARIYGYDTPQELMSGLTNIASQLYLDPTRRDDFLIALSQDDVVQDFESQVYRKDGSVIWISESCRAVRNSAGDFLYFEGMVEDVTQRKQAEDRLLHDALHDALTGLPNRTLFTDRLRHTMKRRERKTVDYAVLFIDCDRFKLINDSLGHLAGDQLLIEMARRIGHCLRSGDTLARLGGDEFVVLAEDMEQLDISLTVADRIRNAVAEPFVLDGQNYYLTTSIGIAYGGAHYSDPGDLLRDADTAMYEAKAQGRDRHVVFEPGMHASAVNQLQLGNDLRRAVENGDELFVVYQPICNMADGSLAGFEALVRWRHPSGEVIAPDLFIPLAEETGLIHPLGKFVLEAAVSQIAQWDRDYDKAKNLFMSVNLSPAQLHRPDIVAEVSTVVAGTGFPPTRVRLEITESGIMHNPAAAKAKLEALKAKGFRLAIDDFGTGYSSLAHLHRFPIDTLKVDRSFISAMLNGGEHLEIVRTILSLGRNLGMSVVAEGVETGDHDSVLRGLACTYGQGWHYSKPLPAAQAEGLMS